MLPELEYARAVAAQETWDDHCAHRCLPDGCYIARGMWHCDSYCRCHCGECEGHGVLEGVGGREIPCPRCRKEVVGALAELAAGIEEEPDFPPEDEKGNYCSDLDWEDNPEHDEPAQDYFEPPPPDLADLIREDEEANVEEARTLAHYDRYYRCELCGFDGFVVGIGGRDVDCSCYHGRTRTRNAEGAHPAMSDLRLKMLI